MKKFILLIILFSSFSQAGSMQSFLDDSINAAVENPGYYQSQTRGLYTLGSGRLRFNNNQSYRTCNTNYTTNKQKIYSKRPFQFLHLTTP